MDDRKAGAIVPRPGWKRRRRLILAAAGLLAVLAVAWTIREDRRARLRTDVVKELARQGVVTHTFGMTPVGLAATLTMGFEPGQEWVQANLGDGWFARPAGFRSETLTDAQAPTAVAQMQRLGGVMEVHLRSPALSEPAIERIRQDLPGAAIVVYATSGQMKVYRRTEGPLAWIFGREETPP